MPWRYLPLIFNMHFLRKQHEDRCERKIRHIILVWRQCEDRNKSILTYALQSWTGMLATRTADRQKTKVDHTLVATAQFPLSCWFGQDCHPTYETGFAPESRAFTQLSHRDVGSEGRIRPGAPRSHRAAVSNRFALTPHFTTTKNASDSCWKSLVFLPGLTVPSARPASKKELATVTCKSLEHFE